MRLRVSGRRFITGRAKRESMTMATPEALREAAEVLGIPEQASLHDIRRRYRDQKMAP